MSPSHSPFRYPGGKGILSDFLIDVILCNNLEGCSYIEPFAGGAGAALTLLFEGIVKDLHLNDADITIYAFWHSVLAETDKFLKMLHDTKVTIDEWQRQKKIFLNERENLLSLGFATFFLNRCNRSGIIYSAGPIGGIEQAGNWKIDVRFNKFELKKRIEKTAFYKDKITVSNQDVNDFLRMIPVESLRTAFIYFDPPYFMKGKKLYMNYFQEEDHVKLSKHIKVLDGFQWVMTYDDVEFIRNLYSRYLLFPYHLKYSLQKKRKGEELLIVPPHIYLPTSMRMNGKSIPLSEQAATKGVSYG